MTRKEIATNALQEIYEKYKDRGILAVYVWGSIITDEFNPETSDIDSVMLVEDHFPLELETEITEYALAKYPELGEFYIRPLYVGELNGGELKGRLATILFPRILLSIMPDWVQVAGDKKYTNQDFGLEPATLPEALESYKKKMKNDGWDDVASIPESMHMFFLKTLGRLIDVIQQMREEKGQFSYQKLKAASKSGAELEQKVMDALLESRDSAWDFAVFQKNQQVFQDFMDLVYG